MRISFNAAANQKESRTASPTSMGNPTGAVHVLYSYDTYRTGGSDGRAGMMEEPGFARMGIFQCLSQMRLLLELQLPLLQ